LNKTSDEDKESLVSEKKKEIEFTMWMVLQDYSVRFVLFGIYIQTIMSTFFESFQANAYHEYGIPDEDVGYIFGSQCFTYAVGCIIVPKLIK
jgi:hypothetical protein